MKGPAQICKRAKTGPGAVWVPNEQLDNGKITLTVENLIEGHLKSKAGAGLLEYLL